MAEAVRNTRIGMNLAMRDVEAMTTAMGHLHPEVYGTFTKSKLANLENDGIEFLRRTKEMAPLRTLIHLLFQTDAHFVEVTGEVPPYGLTDLSSVKRSIPLYREGASVTRADLIAGTSCTKNVDALSPNADYALTVKSKRMEPFVSPSQHVQVALARDVAAGDMAVLRLGGKLSLAWCLDQQYRHASPKSRPFDLGEDEEVLGVVVSVRPFLSASYRKGCGRKAKGFNPWMDSPRLPIGRPC